MSIRNFICIQCIFQTVTYYLNYVFDTLNILFSIILTFSQLIFHLLDFLESLFFINNLF